MRLRNITGSREYISENDYVIHDEKEHKGKWQDVFNNSNPIFVEIGMGKGKFIMQLAKEHPERNYIGIEKYSAVLLRAIQKMEEEPLQNLVFIRMDAEEICDVFAHGEITGIYLNFSDPWPKDRHARRRLPSKEFLARYHQFLKADGVIEFKTDNKALFLFALDELTPAGWQLKEATYDLHHDEVMSQGNVMTEYEEKFSSMGNPIYKYVIYR